MLMVKKMGDDDVMCHVKETDPGIWRCSVIRVKESGRNVHAKNRGNGTRQNQKELVSKKAHIRTMDITFHSTKV